MYAPIEIPRYKAAMFRSKPSFPLSVICSKSLLDKDFPILDYGCGRGFDARWLLAKGYRCNYYDPYYFPHTKLQKSHTVLLTYVLNVIEDIGERERTLIKAFKLATERLIVSSIIRPNYVGHKPFGDGWLTKRGTFEKYWGAKELQYFIEDVLDAPAQRLDQGVYLVSANPESKPIGFHSLSPHSIAIWDDKLHREQAHLSDIVSSLDLPQDVILERYLVKGHEYWRLKSLSHQFEGGRRALYLGKEGSKKYNEIVSILDAREKLKRVERRLAKLQETENS